MNQIHLSNRRDSNSVPMTEAGLTRHELSAYLSNYLNVAQYKDYCPNGLQVEGVANIRCIVGGVTASLALIERAVELQADTVLVHHGYFWRGEDARILGQKQRRLKLLLAHDINLFAYHLPLDAHAELGNNAQLGRLMGWQPIEFFGENQLAYLAELPVPISVSMLGEQLRQVLGRVPQIVVQGDPVVKRVAWCTGAAQHYLQDAIDVGAEVFISGEISEPTVHLAREMGVTYIAAGHHATERYGIQALTQHLTDHFGVTSHFVDIDNPV